MNTKKECYSELGLTFLNSELREMGSFEPVTTLH